MTEVYVEPLITQEQMTEYLHCNVTQVSMLRVVDIFPAIRTGKHYMFTKKTYDNFITNYEGYDVSNKVKAIKAKKKIFDTLVAL